VKTGFTRAAGHCFVGSATRDGRRLIGVVLGARYAAIDEMIPLLSWGFQRFPAVALAKQGETVGTVAIAGGSPGEVPVTAGTICAPAWTVWRFPVPKWSAKSRAPARSRPVGAGQEIGRLVAKVNGQEVGGVPLLAASSVERSAFALLIAPGASSAHKTQDGGGRAWLWKAAAAVGLTLFTGYTGVRWIATKTTKSARRRRRRLAPARRSAHRVR
jgi:D-alanyl-D-alanine carboxypeptidase